MQRSSVDLPEPEAPISATASCSATSKSTPCRTSRSPKALVTPRTSITGPAISAPYPIPPPMRSTSRASGTVITR